MGTLGRRTGRSLYVTILTFSMKVKRKLHTIFFLNSDNTTGTHSLYTLWQGYEIMFHVASYLPYSPLDPQQVFFSNNQFLCTVLSLIDFFV
jgi:hypothetical protein